MSEARRSPANQRPLEIVESGLRQQIPPTTNLIATSLAPARIDIINNRLATSIATMNPVISNAPILPSMPNSNSMNNAISNSINKALSKPNATSNVPTSLTTTTSTSSPEAPKEMVPDKCAWPGCEATFKTQKDLKIHEHQHIAESSTFFFKCNWDNCQMTFARRALFLQHTQVCFCCSANLQPF